MLHISQAWLIFVVDVSLKALLLAGATGLLLFVLRMRDTNLRHRAWTALLAGMLAMPLLVCVTPAIPLPNWMTDWIQPASIEVEPQPIAGAPATTRVDREPRPAVDLAQNGETRGDDLTADPAFSTGPPAAQEPLPAVNLPPQLSDEKAIAEAQAVETVNVRAFLARNWPTMLAGFYFAVASIFLLQLSVGLVLMRLLVKRSSSLQLPAGLRLHPRKDLRLLESACIHVPVTIGFFRPVVLLPVCWREWSEAKLQAVLAHEFAHVRRADWLVMALADLNRAIYWFHPVAWLLKGRLSELAEQNCDDAVLEAVGDRAQYAHYLLEVAASLSESGARYRAPMHGVAMARKPSVETRIEAILDSGRPLARRLGALGIIGLLVVGIPCILIAAALRPAGEKAAEDPPPAAAEAEPASDNKQPEADDDVITVRGTVVDPQGKPVSNADVYALRWYWDFGDPKPLAQVKSDDHGRFEISYRKSQFHDSGARGDQWRETDITAFAEGFGLGWVLYRDLQPGEEPTIRLAVDDVPIEGRIVDLEGNPVAGATIEVGYLNASENEDLTPWLKALSAGQSISTAFEHLGKMTPIATAQRWNGIVTDADGRFRLTGLGREREVKVHVKAPTIITTTLAVVTRKMEPIQHPAYDFEGAHKATVFGAQFEFAAAPSRPIEGVIRNVKTGEPIEGVDVWSSQFAGTKISGLHTIKVKSDAQGKYRLEGMPKGTGNRIVVVPKDRPYFTASFEVPNPPGIEPVKFDVELHRGVWVTGRVTDKQTGRGVPARMFYIAPPDNKAAAELPEFENAAHIIYVQDRYRTAADGSYRVVALPGRGIIGVGAIHDAYPGGQGFDAIADRENRRGYMNYNSAIAPTKKFPTAVKEVQVDEKANEVACDFELDPGRRVAVRVVDPENAPLKDVLVSGISEIGGGQQKLDEQFELIAFRDDEKRTVLLHQKDRQLGKAIRLTADEGKQGPVTVQLEPCATVTGELTNGAGDPVPGVSLRFNVSGDGDYGRSLPGAATNAEGRFRHDALLPGLPYSILAEGASIKFTEIVRKLEVQPGATIDLGKIDITSKERPTPKRTSAEAGATAKQEQQQNSPQEIAFEYAGKVVAPDGKPAAGADLYLVFHIPQPTELLAPTWKPLAKTNETGAFKFKIDAAQFGIGTRSNELRAAAIVAVKEGHGFAWGYSALFETSGQLLKAYREKMKEVPPEFAAYAAQILSGAGQPLKLTLDNEPIRGRVVNVDGEPVAGAKLTLLEIWTSPTDDLTAWRAAASEEKADYYSARMQTSVGMNGPQMRSVVRPTVTDKDGRFTLRGIGRQRIADLLVEGPRIASARIFARTEAGQLIKLQRERRSGDSRTDVYHPAELTHVAGPSVPVTGVVRDAKSGKPLAGVTVKSQRRHGENINGWGQDFIRAVTDAEGRYRLEGLPTGDGNIVGAIAPSDAPYFSITLPAKTKSDQKSLEVNFDLTQGVWITGRITDKQTGKGISGELAYRADRQNPNFKQRGQSVDERDRLQADDSGRFRIAGLPGPGIITFSAFDHEKYPRAAGVTPAGGTMKAQGKAMIETRSEMMLTSNYHFVSAIDPPADVEQYELNLQLDSGGKLIGHVVDPEGKPLDGFEYVGRMARFDHWRPSSKDEFEVRSYDGKSPRNVYFAHRARNLAGSVKLDGEPPQPLVAKLQPAGKVSGRLVDDGGAPLANVSLAPWSRPIASPADAMQLEQSTPLPPRQALGRLDDYETDENGRFSIACLAPAIEYRLVAINRNNAPPGNPRLPRFLGPIKTIINVEPGQVLELGDVKVVSEKELEQELKKAPSPAAAKAGASAAREVKRTDNFVEASGLVLSPEGQPLAGAQIFFAPVSEAKPDDLVVRDTTDAQGRFRFTFPSTELGRLSDGLRSPWNSPYIIARKAGYGPGHKHIVKSGDAKDLTLKLVADDLPIRGRIVDLEGQPVTGAKLHVLSVRGSPSGKLDDWIDSIRKRGEVYGRVAGIWLEDTIAQNVSGLPATVVTDENGQFTLTGMGRERVVYLRLEGPQIEVSMFSAMSRQSELLQFPLNKLDPQIGTFICYGADFTHSVAPSQPVRGIVRDANSGKPIPGVLLYCSKQAGLALNGRFQPEATADGDGKYVLNGLRKGSDNKIAVVPPAGNLFVPQNVIVDTSRGLEPKALDIDLKPGVPIHGRVTDSATGRPVAKAHVEYFAHVTNHKLREFAGFNNAQNITTVTDADGRYRIAGLPGRGFIAIRAATDEFTAGHLIDINKSECEIGPSMRLCTIRTVPATCVTGYYHAITGVDAPEADQNEIVHDVVLERGQAITARITDANGQPVNGSQVNRRGMYACDWLGGDVEVSGSEFTIYGLMPGKKRALFLQNESRHLVGAFTVAADQQEPVELRLVEAGKIIGRIVDEDARPISNEHLTVRLAEGQGELSGRFFSSATSDDAGRFEIQGLTPGLKYQVGNLAQRGDKVVLQMHQADAPAGLVVESGQTLDLGDVRFGRSADRAAADSKSKTQAAEETVMAKTPEKSAVATPANRCIIHGRVVGIDGKPAAGANVAAIGMRATHARGGDLEPYGAVLGEVKADADGNYLIELTGVSSKTHRYANVIARAGDSALAWKGLDLDADDVEATFKLGPEEVISGRMVNIEGQPAANVNFSVVSIMLAKPPEKMPQAAAVSFFDGLNPPAAWVQPVATDREGRFSIYGVPRNHGVYLKTRGSDTFAPQEITLNTGMPEQRGERDRTYRPLVKNTKPGEEAVLPLAPAQLFTGTVSFADTKQPAPFARLTIWASQQKYGSMTSVAGKADENGKYRMTPNPGTQFGVTAYPPDGVAYLPRQMKPVAWKSGTRSKEVDVALPRGVLVRGQVLEEGTDAPVVGASIQYLCEEANNKNHTDDILTGWQDIHVSDAQGRFDMAVLPGPGRLFVHGPKNEYVFIETSSKEVDSGSPGGTRYYTHGVAHIDPAKDAEPLDVTIRIKRGATIKGTLVDVAGKSIENALLVSRLYIRPLSLEWRGHPLEIGGGKFELSGLAPNQEHPVHFLDSKRRLGATAMLKAGMESPRVVLKPCGQAKMRFVDDAGKPVANFEPNIYMTITPGSHRYDQAAYNAGKLSADADFISNIDRPNHQGFEKADDEGRITVSALVPG